MTIGEGGSTDREPLVAQDIDVAILRAARLKLDLEPLDCNRVFMAAQDEEAPRCPECRDGARLYGLDLKKPPEITGRFEGGRTLLIRRDRAEPLQEIVGEPIQGICVSH